MSAPLGRLILASASPQRLALLRQIGFEPDLVVPAAIDEAPRRRELPRAHAKRVVLGKLEAVSAQYPRDCVLAADTVVACGRRILPKPGNPREARQCLELLSGRRHRVYGAIAMQAPGGKPKVRLVVTSVSFKRLTAPEIDAYIASGEWRERAGGYAIQGRAAAFVRAINGSYPNVVGLGLFEVRQMLQSLGRGPTVE
jgi:septum formation protein